MIRAFYFSWPQTINQSIRVALLAELLQDSTVTAGLDDVQI